MKKLDTLIKRITEGFVSSGFIVNEISVLPNNMVIFKINKINNYELYAFIRHVSKSGWSDKPQVRRVQIAKFNINELIASGSTKTCMILGVQELLDRDIFVAWDIYNYGNHKTNRSCYVSANNIFKAFINGYLTTTDSNQKVWISDPFHLDVLLNDYIKHNWSSLGE